MYAARSDLQHFLMQPLANYDIPRKQSPGPIAVYMDAVLREK